MGNSSWQQRAKRAGLTQKDLATLLGVAPNTISRQLRGELSIQLYVVNFIRAWEFLSQQQRDILWISATNREDENSARLLDHHLPKGGVDFPFSKNLLLAHGNREGAGSETEEFQNLPRTPGLAEMQAEIQRLKLQVSSMEELLRNKITDKFSH